MSPITRPPPQVRRQRRSNLFGALFALWPSRRRHVRVVSSADIRRRDSQFIIFSKKIGWFGSLIVHALSFALEFYLSRMFFRSHALQYYLSRIKVMGVEEMWDAVQSVLQAAAAARQRQRRPFPQLSAGAYHALAVVVHLKGRLSVGSTDCLALAPKSGVHCLRFRWALEQTYLEKRTVTKRRKLPSQVTTKKKTKKKHKKRQKKKKTKKKKKKKKKSKGATGGAGKGSGDASSLMISSASSSCCSSSSSSSSSDESLYEEWEEDETVERTETLDSGNGVARSPFAVVDSLSFPKYQLLRPAEALFGGDIGGGGFGVPRWHNHPPTLKVDAITHWGGEEIVLRDDKTTTGFTDVLMAPFSKRMNQSLELTEHVVHDGAHFEFLGLLVVDLGEESGGCSAIAGASLQPIGRTIATASVDRVNIVGPVQSLNGVLAKVQRGTSDLTSAEFSPREHIPYLAETMSSPSSSIEGSGASRRHKILQYVWLAAAALAFLLRTWSGRQFILRAFGVRANWLIKEGFLPKIALLAVAAATSPLAQRLLMVVRPRS